MTTREVAQEVGASERTVRWWIARGWLRATPTTRGWVVTRVELADCMAYHQHEMRPMMYALRTGKEIGLLRPATSRDRK